MHAGCPCVYLYFTIAFDRWSCLYKVGLICFFEEKGKGAAGADALAETGKGFSQYITVVGLCETVALFALVFSMVALG